MPFRAERSAGDAEKGDLFRCISKNEGELVLGDWRLSGLDGGGDGASSSMRSVVRVSFSVGEVTVGFENGDPTCSPCPRDPDGL